MNTVHAAVNSRAVHIHDILALLRICLNDGVLHIADCLVDINDICDIEVSSLKNGICTSCAQSDLLGYINRIAGIESDIIFSDVSLYCCRDMLLKLLVVPGTVKEKCSARLNILHHLVFCEICRVMACNKVCLLNVVGRLDRAVPKTKM